MKCIVCNAETNMKIKLGEVGASFCHEHAQSCKAFLASQKAKSFEDMPMQKIIVKCIC